jgi:electron transfer flavoprotein beta subunit
MKIVVCIKAVPVLIGYPQIAETRDRFNFKASNNIMNETDEYALEAALALKKELGGEIVVITAGSLQSQQVLYTGLAKGADRAIRIDASFADGERTAIVLAEAIKKIGYDLILAGVESSDNMAAQVGMSIAERLGVPSAYAVTNVARGPQPNTMAAVKELGNGLKQALEIKLPALLCTQATSMHLSYVPARKLIQARAMTLECLSLKDLNISKELLESGPYSIVDVFPPPRMSKAEILGGQLSEVAAVLVQRIREAL